MFVLGEAPGIRREISGTRHACVRGDMCVWPLINVHDEEECGCMILLIGKQRLISLALILRFLPIT